MESPTALALGRPSCRKKDRLKSFYGAERDTTNNIQELKGAINALKQLKKTNIPIEIHVDSTYVLNGVTS